MRVRKWKGRIPLAPSPASPELKAPFCHTSSQCSATTDGAEKISSASVIVPYMLYIYIFFQSSNYQSNVQEVAQERFCRVYRVLHNSFSKRWTWMDLARVMSAVDPNLLFANLKEVIIIFSMVGVNFFFFANNKQNLTNTFMEHLCIAVRWVQNNCQ